MTVRDPRTLLLADDEPSPVRIVNAAGASPFLILGDHAGRLVPRFLGSGFTSREVTRLFALDRALGLDTLLQTGALETLRCVFDGFPLVCTGPG